MLVKHLNITARGAVLRGENGCFFSYECDCTSNRFAVCEALESGVILKPIFSTLLIASCHFNSLKLRFCVIRVFVCAGRSLVV